MTDISESIADQQRAQWERSYFEDPEMFGDQPSLPAMYAAIIFHDEGKTDILELGPGQGRDTLYFLQQGLNVWALDYAEQGLLKIEELAKTMKEKPEFGSLTTIRHDLRFSLPFPDNFFDACFSHMLYCMAFSSNELVAMNKEVHRVLKPGGLNIFTVRTTIDKHSRTGSDLGDGLRENYGFVVRFFDDKQIDELAYGFDILDRFNFQEEELPRELQRITFRKKFETWPT